MENLRGRTISGLFWNLLERVGIRIVQFLPTIILARLLSPEQFGLIGMLTLFVALAQTFLDSGFGVALIQKKDATYTDECSIFYFNILLGGFSVLILFFAAPLIANFYRQPILAGLLRWLSLDILIESFSLIQIALLTRELDFKTQLKANLSATFIGGIFGVAAAYYGLGVWSLVIQTIANTALQTLILWWLHRWRPGLVFSLASLKSMFGFGSRMLSSSLVSVFFDNLYQVFIGKVFSAAPLGYYTRASSLRTIVIDTTSNTLGRVMFPALASIQDDQERLKQAYRKSIRFTTFAHFPIMAGLIVTAKPLITLLFSEKWGESVLFFQLMCAAGLLYPLHLLNLNILKVKGRSDLFFRLELIKRVLVVLTIIITYRWGINAMLIGQIAFTLFVYGLNSFYSGMLIGYPTKAQILDVMPSLAFSCLMAGGMFFAGYILRSSNFFVQIAIQALVGAGSYFALHALAKSESLAEIVNLIRQLLVSNLRLRNAMK